MDQTIKWLTDVAPYCLIEFVPKSDITVKKSVNLPSEGTILIGTELITYTSNNTTTGVLSGIARGASGSTATTHA